MRLSTTAFRGFLQVPFVRGVATFQLGSVGMMLTGFASSILYARLLGLREFGLYALITASAGLAGILLSYGQDTALVTFLAEARGRKDTVSSEKILRYYLQATGISLLLTILVFIATPTLTMLLHRDLHIMLLARLLILNTALQSMNVLAFLALQLEKRIKTVAIVENVADIFQLALCVLLILQGWGVAGIVWGTLITSLLGVPVYACLYERSAMRQGLPSLISSIGKIGRLDTGSYFMQGFWIALDRNIGNNLYPNIFYIILNATASLDAVGIFRLAFRLASLPLSFLMPSITRMAAVAIPRIVSEGKGQLIKASRKILIGTLGLSAAASIGAAIVVSPLIPVVYGNAFTAAILPFLLLLPMNILSSAHVISVPVLRAVKRVWVISITNSVSILLAVGIYFTLLHLLPAVIAMSISIVLYHFFSLSLFGYLYLLYGKKVRGFRN